MQITKLIITLGLIVAVGGIAVLLEPQAKADERSAPDPEITGQTVILLPNWAYYQTWIDGVYKGVYRAPFGGGAGCPLQERTTQTYWPAFSKLLLQKRVYLPEGATNLRLLVSADNDVTITLNKRSITEGTVVHEYCPMVNEFLFPSRDAILKTGEWNDLKIEVTDRGGTTYFDAIAYYDLQQ